MHEFFVRSYSPREGEWKRKGKRQVRTGDSLEAESPMLAAAPQQIPLGAQCRCLGEAVWPSAPQDSSGARTPSPLPSLAPCWSVGPKGQEFPPMSRLSGPLCLGSQRTCEGPLACVPPRTLEGLHAGQQWLLAFTERKIHRVLSRKQVCVAPWVWIQYGAHPWIPRSQD